MTMPQSCNCAHQGDGWCLSCVIDLCGAINYHRAQSELKDKEIAELQVKIRVLRHEIDCLNGDAEYGN